MEFSDHQMEEALRFSTLDTYKINEVICEIDYNSASGKRPPFFFIVLKGSVCVTSCPFNTSIMSKLGMKRKSSVNQSDSPRTVGNQKTICSYISGDTFGEANVCEIMAKEGTWKWTSTDDTEILKIPLETYNETLRELFENELEERVLFLKNLVVPIFHGYKDSLLLELVKSFYVQHVPSRKTILKQGREGSMMYFIKSGEVTVLKKLKFQEDLGVKIVEYVKFVELCRLKQKEYFGERCLLLDALKNDDLLPLSPSRTSNSFTRATSIFTITESVIYAVKWSSFTNCK